MSEAQQLREQLEELGFTQLEDSRENFSTVLTVEAWVRYNPYALIPIPIRGEDESDDTYNSRIEIANESIAEIFAQDARDAVLLDQQHTEPHEGVTAEYQQEEYAEEPVYDIPAATDYYAYVPPPVGNTAQLSAPVYEADIPAIPTDENVEPSAPVEYAEAHRAKLVAVRASLILALEEIDAILGS